MASTVYVLQVGINQYPNGVGSLNGCVNDVHRIHDYVTKTFGDAARTVQLLDSDANRKNVVKQFREHLCKAGSGDVVLFHYSGHGARWKSAPDFQKWFPDGWDEGLVLHDSRMPGGFDLADKELAILLAEVAKNEPHITVLFDCCHSGGATRGLDDFTQLKVRQTHTVNDPRPLDSYLDGYYTDLVKKGMPLQLPSSKHILLAACERKQKAWEGRNFQGVFTSSLLEVLSNSAQDLSYANVFLRCREAVRNRASDQDPQFETYGGFKAYGGFLGQSASTAARRCTVIFDGNQGEWLLNRGAIHGLSTAADKVTTAEIYPAGKSVAVGNARTLQVGAQNSQLEFVGFEPAADAQYEAELTSMPIAPMSVVLIANDLLTSQIDQFIKKTEEQILDFSLDKNIAATKYALRVTGDLWQIELCETEKLVLGARGDFEKSAEHIFAALNKIAQWERLLKLQNDTTKLNAKNVDLQLLEIANDGEHAIDGLSFTGNVQNEQDTLQFKLVANNTSAQELHFTLLYMPEDYSIAIPYKQAIEPTKDKFEFVFAADGSESPIIYAGVDGDSGETQYILKLLVSTEQVDDFLLQREPIEGLGEIASFPVTRNLTKGRGAGFGQKPRAKITYKNEWFTKTVTLRIALQKDRVGADKDVKLAGGQITIKANSAVKADVAISSARTRTRDVGATNDFYKALELSGASLFNFSKTRGEDQTILELSEIQADAETLRQNPLEIELDTQLKDDEYILPIAFDGESMFVTGQSRKDTNGRTLIRIEQIPETPTNRRSLYSALKLYFFKCIGIANVNQLRWVEYDNGLVRRHSSGVAEKVAVASRVLVLIHGIIGDTEGIAAGLPLVNLGTGTLDQKFDLVLTYDYENLNTSIKTTAQLLRKQLEEVGIKADDQKHVTFLVHSMGGLVARWFIEHEGGNKIVDHLAMCGTPNSGSPFGEIGRARTVVATLGTLAINVFPATAPYLGPVLYALNQSQKVTPTLEEMSQDSSFMKELAGLADPSVQYSIIAGDVRKYDATKDALTARLVAKLGKGFAFSGLFGQEAHDIAVRVDSIRSVKDTRAPKPDKQSVTCHHLNYFVADEGLKALAKIDW